MLMDWVKKVTLAKVVVGFAALFLTAAGLCGIQSLFMGKTNQGLDRFLGVTGILELLAMNAAIFGLLVCMAIWLISAVFFRK
jgi:hypothetical protein